MIPIAFETLNEIRLMFDMIDVYSKISLIVKPNPKS